MDLELPVSWVDHSLGPWTWAVTRAGSNRKKHILCDCGTFNAPRILLPDAGVTKAETPGLLTVKSSEQIEEKLLQNVMWWCPGLQFRCRACFTCGRSQCWLCGGPAWFSFHSTYSKRTGFQTVNLWQKVEQSTPAVSEATINNRLY